MIIKQNKLLKIILVVLFLLLIIIQTLNCRNIINKKELLLAEISVQQEEISNLEAEYIYKKRNSKLGSIRQAPNLKEKTAEILSKLESFNLELIDFSSSEAELNLNLSGDFSTILNFIYYLEAEIKALKISEFKIKKNSGQLFFYLKLKNELI